MSSTAILHLLNNFSDSSITRIVYNLVRLLPNDISWHIGVLQGSGSLRKEFMNQGANTIDFTSKGNGRKRVAGQIADYISSHGITIVHSHTPRTLLMAAIATRKITYVKHVATKHILNAPGDRRLGIFHTILDRLSLYLPHHLVAVSRRICDTITTMPGINADRVSLIQNAIDTESLYAPELRISCRSEFGLVPTSLVIGTIGRLDEVKRLDLLIKGFGMVLANYPQARLMLVGEGELKQDLQLLAKKLNLSNSIIWTGFREDISRLLAAMDIYVQASANEGLSLSVLEAMAAEKPVVITDVGGAREIVTDGSTGIIIMPKSASSIGSALIDLSGDSLKQAKLAKSARLHICREFSIGKMIQSYQNLYNAFV